MEFIPHKVLSAAAEALSRRLQREGIKLFHDIDDPHFGEPLRFYLLIRHCPDLLENEQVELSEGSLLYNSYYWFRRFANAYSASHGSDEGLEQAAFRLLENSTFEIDWTIVEELDRLAE